MRTLWVCHPQLNSLSVQDTLHTALKLAYPSAPSITIVQPKHLSFQPHLAEEMFKQIDLNIQRYNIQRILITMFPSDVRTSTAFIGVCGQTYATTVAVFDHPVFLPENVPTIEEWLRESWRHAVVKETMVALRECWEVVSQEKRTLRVDPKTPYDRNIIKI